MFRVKNGIVVNAGHLGPRLTLGCADVLVCEKLGLCSIPEVVNMRSGRVVNVQPLYRTHRHVIRMS